MPNQILNGDYILAVLSDVVSQLECFGLAGHHFHRNIGSSQAWVLDVPRLGYMRSISLYSITLQTYTTATLVVQLLLKVFVFTPMQKST